MKSGARLYLIEDMDSNGWNLVPTVPRDTTLRRKALLTLVASGIPRPHAVAVLGISQATFTRDVQALESMEPEFGTDAWALAHHERQAARLRRKIGRDDSADESIGN